ncbi:hypothetical protein BC828DRAFT_401519 [Blastocladiella britannica]|nr:hypothetical protein BC828DRAFT_401519 [Blastocladiella britannica]
MPTKPLCLLKAACHNLVTDPSAIIMAKVNQACNKSGMLHSDGYIVFTTVANCNGALAHLEMLQGGVWQTVGPFVWLTSNYKMHACFVCYLFGHVMAHCPNLRHYMSVPSPHHIPQIMLPTYNMTDNPPGPGCIVLSAMACPSGAGSGSGSAAAGPQHIAPVAPATALKGGSNMRFNAAMADTVKTLLGHMLSTVIAGDLAAAQQMTISFVSMAKSTGLDKSLYAGLMLPFTPVAIAVVPKTVPLAASQKCMVKSESEGKDEHPACHTTLTQTNCKAVAEQCTITAAASMATLLPGELAAQALACTMAWFTTRQSAWTTPALPTMIVLLPAPLSAFSAAAGLLAPTTLTTPTNPTASTTTGSAPPAHDIGMEVDTVSTVPLD